MAVERTGTISTYAAEFRARMRDGKISLHVVTDVDGMVVKDQDVVFTQDQAAAFMAQHMETFLRMADAIDNWLVENGYAKRDDQ